MPVPRAVARFNRRYTNRFIEPIVRRSSGFAVVHHVGRRSGEKYHTPVNVFDLEGDLIVALTYGPSADWLQNVLAGRGHLVRRSVTVEIVSAAVVGRETAWPALPWFVRVGLRALRVREFARLGVEQPSLCDTPSPGWRHGRSGRSQGSEGAVGERPGCRVRE